MTVRKNIQAKMDKIQEEREASGNGSSATANHIQEMAVKAIMGGPADWVEYMRIYALPDKPEQLARLIPTDGTNDDDRQKARAYLVANGTCGAGTTGRLIENVTDALNEG